QIYAPNGSQACIASATINVTYTKPTVPVAILGSSAIPANQIVFSSLKFAGAPAVQTVVGDTNGDRISDLTARFAMHGLTLIPGDTTATLSGKLTSGQPIQGTDPIQIVTTPQTCTSCGGYGANGGCWYTGALNQSCNTVCANHGGFNRGTAQHTGNPICS